MGGPGMIYVSGPKIGSAMRLGTGKQRGKHSTQCGHTGRRNYNGDLNTVGGMGY